MSFPWGPQVNKFEEVSSDGHQSSAMGRRARVSVLMSGGQGWGGPRSDVQGTGTGARRGLYSEV